MKNVIEPQGINRTLCAEDLADLELRNESLYIAACSPEAFIFPLFSCLHHSQAVKE